MTASASVPAACTPATKGAKSASAHARRNSFFGFRDIVGSGKETSPPAAGTELLRRSQRLLVEVDPHVAASVLAGPCASEARAVDHRDVVGRVWLEVRSHIAIPGISTGVRARLDVDRNCRRLRACRIKNRAG